MALGKFAYLHCHDMFLVVPARISRKLHEPRGLEKSMAWQHLIWLLWPRIIQNGYPSSTAAKV